MSPVMKKGAFRFTPKERREICRHRKPGRGVEVMKYFVSLKLNVSAPRAASRTFQTADLSNC
jgi:hypothetical protein